MTITPSSSTHQQPAQDGVTRTLRSFEEPIRRRRRRDRRAAGCFFIRVLFLTVWGFCWAFNSLQSLFVTACTTRSIRGRLVMSWCHHAELNGTYQHDPSTSVLGDPISSNLTANIQRIMVAPLELESAYSYLQINLQVAQRSPLVQRAPLPSLLEDLMGAIDLLQPGFDAFVSRLCVQMDEVSSFHRHLVADLDRIEGLPRRYDEIWVVHLLVPMVETYRLFNLYFNSRLGPQQYSATALYGEVMYQVGNWAKDSHHALDQMTNGFLDDDFPTIMRAVRTLSGECNSNIDELDRQLLVLKRQVMKTIPARRDFYVNVLGIEDVEELRPYNIEQASLTNIKATLTSLYALVDRFRKDHGKMKTEMGILRDRFEELTSGDIVQGRLRDMITLLKEYTRVIGGSRPIEKGWVAQMEGERERWKAGKGMQGKMARGVRTWSRLLKVRRPRDEL